MSTIKVKGHAACSTYKTEVAKSNSKGKAIFFKWIAKEAKNG